MGAKSSGDRLLRKRTFTHLKVTPLTTYYAWREKGTFTVERSGRHDIDLIKPSKTVETEEHRVPTPRGDVGKIHHLSITSCQKYLTKSNNEETNRPNRLWDTRQMACTLQNCQHLGNKKSWRNCSRLKKNKDCKSSAWSMIGSWVSSPQEKGKFENGYILEK